MKIIVCLLCILAISCESQKKPSPDILTSELALENNRLIMVLCNGSDHDLMVCSRNFYNPIECLDIRAYPDTAKIPAEILFGERIVPIKKSIVTVSDYYPLKPNEELKLHVDLRFLKKTKRLPDTVLMAVYFKNINPFLCSGTAVSECDKALLNYCSYMHYLPDKTRQYWHGEIRTPYFKYSLGSLKKTGNKKRIISSVKRRG